MRMEIARARRRKEEQPFIEASRGGEPAPPAFTSRSPWAGSPSTYKSLSFSSSSNRNIRNTQAVPTNSFTQAHFYDFQLDEFAATVRRKERALAEETAQRRARFLESLPGNRAKARTAGRSNRPPSRSSAAAIPMPSRTTSRTTAAAVARTRRPHGESWPASLTSSRTSSRPSTAGARGRGKNAGSTLTRSLAVGDEVEDSVGRQAAGSNGSNGSNGRRPQTSDEKQRDEKRERRSARRWRQQVATHAREQLGMDSIRDRTLRSQLLRLAEQSLIEASDPNTLPAGWTNRGPFFRNPLGSLSRHPCIARYRRKALLLKSELLAPKNWGGKRCAHLESGPTSSPLDSSSRFSPATREGVRQTSSEGEPTNRAPPIPVSPVRRNVAAPHSQLEPCRFTVFELCPLGCGDEYSHSEMGRHKEHGCPKRRVFCPRGCGGGFRVVSLKAHYELCQGSESDGAAQPAVASGRGSNHDLSRQGSVTGANRGYPCRFACGDILDSMEAVQMHESKVCREREVACPRDDCAWKGAFRKRFRHLEKCTAPPSIGEDQDAIDDAAEAATAAEVEGAPPAEDAADGGGGEGGRGGEEMGGPPSSPIVVGRKQSGERKKVLYLCERGCGKEVALRKRKDHNEKRCEYRDMVCERPDCGGRFIASLEWQHNRFECKSVGVQMKRAAAEKRAVAGRGEGRVEGQQSGGGGTEKGGEMGLSEDEIIEHD